MGRKLTSFERRGNGQYSDVTYDLGKSTHIAKYIARHGFSWPGGYELFAITRDCAVICRECCRAEFPLIAGSTGTDGWHISGMASMAEVDGPERCDHCGKEIPE